MNSKLFTVASTLTRNGWSVVSYRLDFALALGFTKTQLCPLSLVRSRSTKKKGNARFETGMIQYDTVRFTCTCGRYLYVSRAFHFRTILNGRSFTH